MPYQRKRTPIGQRRERITVQVATTVDDGMGGQTETWTDLVKTWAAVTPLDERDKEGMRAAQITATHAYHVDLRYRDDITPQMRALWRGKTLQIHTVVDDDARKRRLILQVAEVQ